MTQVIHSAHSLAARSELQIHVTYHLTSENGSCIDAIILLSDRSSTARSRITLWQPDNSGKFIFGEEPSQELGIVLVAVVDILRVTATHHGSNTRLYDVRVANNASPGHISVAPQIRYPLLGKKDKDGSELSEERFAYHKIITDTEPDADIQKNASVALSL